MRASRTLFATLLIAAACALAGVTGTGVAAAQSSDPSPDPGQLWNAYPIGPQSTPTSGGALAPRATATPAPDGSGADVFSAIVYGIAGIFVTAVLFLRPWSRKRRSRRPAHAAAAAVRAANAARRDVAPERAAHAARPERPAAEPVASDADYERTVERLEDLRRSIGRRISDQPLADADAARREAERRRTAGTARRRPAPPSADPARSRRRSRRFARPAPRVLRAPHPAFTTSELRLTRTPDGDGRFLATAPSIDGDAMRVAESAIFPWPAHASDADEGAARGAYQALVSAMVTAGWEPEGPDGPWLASPDVAVQRHG